MSLGDNDDRIEVVRVVLVKLPWVMPTSSLIFVIGDRAWGTYSDDDVPLEM